jgi:hypothetical protein
MFVGLDGTVGGFLGAAKQVLGKRAEDTWKALNEPIKIGAVGSQLDKVARSMTAGSIADAEYDQESARVDLNNMIKYGFIEQLRKSYARQRNSRAFYHRGPTTFGVQDNDIVGAAETQIRGLRDKNEELVIAGYSRGGLNAVNLCNRLIEDGQRVDLLILFDPVDRDVTLGGCDISAGVRNCLLLQRNGGGGISWKPVTRKVAFGIKIPDVEVSTQRWSSRWYFGRMVTERDKGNLAYGEMPPPLLNDATHAAFGGLPWTGDFPSYLNQGKDRLFTVEMTKYVNEQVERLCDWKVSLRLTLEEQREKVKK